MPAVRRNGEKWDGWGLSSGILKAPVSSQSQQLQWHTGTSMVRGGHNRWDGESFVARVVSGFEAASQAAYRPFFDTGKLCSKSMKDG